MTKKRIVALAVGLAVAAIAASIVYALTRRSATSGRPLLVRQHEPDSTTGDDRA
jgi:hypothetical protein